MSEVYVIAEAGVNHNGCRHKAFDLVDAAAAAGANAVKFQTFEAKQLAAGTAPKASYQNRTTDVSQTQLEMLQALELPREWHVPLQEHARKLGIEFLSTAFDRHSLAFLETLDLPFYKVASGELTNGPLLVEFARTGKPLVVSTGMATLSEVEQALAVICYALSHDTPAPSFNAIWQCWSEPAAREKLRGRVSLLHCTSQYPTEMREVNLKAMDTLSRIFQLPVGYSDHTDGTLIPVAAVARGATIIEKHFTLDRNLPGPDHEASLEPRELAEMVASIKSIAMALGDGYKVPQESEWDTRRAARQNLVAAVDIRRGEVFTERNVTTARVGHGELGLAYWDRLGQTAARDYQVGEAL